ncbi:hypothetical protein [Extibacter muris]|uniref:hypothetical protein n=1 Tax=Extibacter muris TaxID=1796622 RepID=UPI001D070221|nr:hypothetical protein [Extibacter muris]MCB6201631.1 hypothetical protein [Extibacter muris]MCQ4662957.1 hypothetical protein [Extibacter muris]MCQ4693223.1 hypothetical protein [Extibacter muris]
MKRFITGLILAALLATGTAAAGKYAADTVSTFAQQKNQEKALLVQERIQETVTLLESLSTDPYIRSQKNSYQEKAALLTDKNQNENLGYMMLRILDAEINIYREDIGLASNLASRDYMQKLYTTGKTQVTDAFLAGADGKTINYTVAVAIMENSQAAGALMAAIYGDEIDGYLTDERSANVLVGSQLQYMGGVSKEQFGLAVAQVLENERNTTRPAENILVDLNEHKSGSFWSLGSHIQYVAYTPVEGTNWSVMTEVRVLPIVRNILIIYGCGAAVLLVSGILLLRPKKNRQEKTRPR